MKYFFLDKPYGIAAYFLAEKFQNVVNNYCEQQTLEI